MANEPEAALHGRDTTGRRPAWTASDRVAHYREQAAQFQSMAEAEAKDAARDRLLDLARQYDRLAIKLAVDPRG